jgi:hypothetical protein
MIALEAHRDSRLADRRGAVYAAVERNDPEAIAQSFARCGADCTDERDRLLLFAADARAHRAIEALLALGARPSSDPRTARSLRARLRMGSRQTLWSEPRPARPPQNAGSRGIRCLGTATVCLLTVSLGILKRSLKR